MWEHSAGQSERDGVSKWSRDEPELVTHAGGARARVGTNGDESTHTHTHTHTHTQCPYLSLPPRYFFLTPPKPQRPGVLSGTASEPAFFPLANFM